MPLRLAQTAIPAILALMIMAPAAGAADGWTPTGSLGIARSSHTATRLANGKVLIAGGYNQGNAAQATAELYDPATGTFTPTGNMIGARAVHTATLLPNGKVLVTGGRLAGPFPTGTYFNTAEIYDPATGTWSATQNMSAARARHSATLLPTGRVLVIGGTNAVNGCNVAAAQLYNPATGTWTNTGPVIITRCGHSATLLTNGKVLIAGGSGTVVGGGSTPLSTEIYDPMTGSFAPGGDMNTTHTSPAAALLPNGQVLVAGGGAEAEVYDPTADTWSVVDPMSSARRDPALTVLPSGRALVSGGWFFDDAISEYVLLASSELYDPATGSWSDAGTMTAERGFSHTSTLLLDGSVLVTGGIGGSGGSPNVTTTSADLYGPLPTATPTATATDLPTSTATATPTTTETETETPTHTPTAPVAATLTATASDTPTLSPTPSATPTVTPTAVCAATPLAGCRAPGRSALKLARRGQSSSLSWDWKRGTATDRFEFGNPRGTTQYALCLYAATGLVMTVVVPPDGTCANRPCWTERPAGFLYNDRDKAADGIKRLSLRGGADGKAMVTLRGAGPNLPLPTPVTATRFLADDTDVVVQLVNSENDICWEARYPPPARRNTGTDFRAGVP